MKEIELTFGKKAIIDDEDFDLVSSRSWYFIKKGYACSGDRSTGRLRIFYLHRFLMNPEKGMVIDHINGDPLDNRRSNLRACRQSQNCQNRKAQKNNKLGLKGVCKDTKKNLYRSSIMKDGKLVFLGYSKTPEEAHEKYKKAAIELHGEFALY